MTKLPDVSGRIYYISSHARQENLYAVYETKERKFWSELAKCNQEEFTKSGTDGKCIEAREFIIALPENFVDYQPDMILKLFTEHFRQNYGVECIAALHHNKRKTNYHIHLIFSERKLLEQPIEKIASRNMFYDEAGKSWVYVVKKSRLAIAEVTVVGTVDDMSVIEGLSVGTAVVTNPSLAKEQQKVHFK